MTFYRILFLLIAIASTAQGATQGEQTHQLLFKSGSIIWIAEDIGGAYELSVLHQIVISDSGAVGGESLRSNHADWSFVDKLKEHFQIEPVIELTSQDHTQWGNPRLDWTVRPPTGNASLEQAFVAHVHDGGDNAKTFYATHAGEGRHSPIVESMNTRPLLFSDRGLFFNYTINTAWYFPRSRLLLVFTHQPTRAVGLDTMHGFVLMEVLSE
ncbi:hypothetical protein AU468_08025 [Alkalispirochaeta sphaeroplastigenens]|uniref:Uncharacterized protein n=1 Tax=Alkalispirochaeta sphaeroplastigenens TaxID=1187066 RepID=A0A2S4JPQ9_9SPIO|nr:hypothetical protein [Alkalispirochaeta sphaeroplastigenens]POR01501.1 hypothetical protein AU468_08025 [Alkalispirochaeta sphaeroplastigenens]